MISFFGTENTKIYAVQTPNSLNSTEIKKLEWLFGNQPLLAVSEIGQKYVGPRATMITPWSTNATEITQNMGISGIQRIEEFFPADSHPNYDRMLFQEYIGLHQNIFKIDITPAPILEIQDVAAFNEKEGLALNEDEVAYLEELANSLGRKLTDSEVFGFSQVNSEHCRHKIFNGTFIIDGEEKPDSLFQMIKKTSKKHPNEIVSAYKDNVAFLKGPKAIQFAPKTAEKPDFYTEKEFDAIISLKAETHNFPTTVEPFNGAATGSGGEIRDRLAGGTGSIPLAGTAVYMTSYPRLDRKAQWEENIPSRKWLYQSPLDILIKASNGASDFGNKFGQPLISGSVLTFEHQEGNKKITAFDKVIMLAGGIGYGKAEMAQKKTPKTGDRIVVLGGDNYRIGMGGAAVSSADTGAFESAIELNAVQRSNPEMQKRAANAIRGMVEADENPIVSIHDHGAGGHLNCLSELVEETGGDIDLNKLPVGDPTLSAKELIGNESQERMGLVMGEEHLPTLRKIAERERAPLFDVGRITGDHKFSFTPESGKKPIDLELSAFFGSSPKTILEDQSLLFHFPEPAYSLEHFHDYLDAVLQLEAVACKDWLTNKVDRCVGGRVAKQQCVGTLQLPLNNCGVMALDFKGKKGIATSIGHSPISGLIDPVAGSQNSIAEALTNIIWAPLEKGLASVSLSANWMWPCKNPGEDARLYQAVEACSDFAIALGINIPTGKDSLSMKQKYADQEVLSPGTVIISAAGNCADITQVVEPSLQVEGGDIYYLNMSSDTPKLGGSSFYQTLNAIGVHAPKIEDPAYFKNSFNTIQDFILKGKIKAGHDVGSGGLITTLLEMCFPNKDMGMSLDVSAAVTTGLIPFLFAENAAIVFQTDVQSAKEMIDKGLKVIKLGSPTIDGKLTLKGGGVEIGLNVASKRDQWYHTSYLLDQQQTANDLAKARFDNYKHQPLQYVFPELNAAELNSKIRPAYQPKTKRPVAAILREKGSNSEREMANAMYLAGFEVKDVHMTDLITGREDLCEVQFLGAVGGFSNSDVLGSAKGWAGAIKYNEKANRAIKNFFQREDTLSVGICNGCQLFMELDLMYPDHKEMHGKMVHNDSNKHESAFTSVKIESNNSVMLGSMAGTTLGVWISHGEGKFELPLDENEYHIVAKFGYDAYPSNPNGSDYNTAMLCDKTGRHLATMPHIERSIYPWNWAYYPKNRQDEVSPWIQAFINAREWCEEKK